MPIHVLLADPNSARLWVAAGAPLPGFPPFTHFGNAERISRSRENLIGDREAYRVWLEKGGWALFADWCRLDLPRVWTVPELTFWEHGVDDLQMRAIDLFGFLDRFHPLFGWACLHEEWAERHLYKYECDWASRPNTSPVGKDPTRYVPGLYWVTCFSRELIERFQLDLDAVASELGGELKRLANCTLLKLYERADDWPTHHERLAAFLRESPKFFSLDRVEKLPKSISIRDITLEMIRVTRPWP